MLCTVLVHFYRWAQLLSPDMWFRRGIRGKEEEGNRQNKSFKTKMGMESSVEKLRAVKVLFLSSRATLFPFSCQFRFAFEQFSLAALWQPVIAHRWKLSTDAVCCEQRARPRPPHNHYTDENGNKGLVVCVGWYTCNYTY